jgi:hypothetical protein
MKERYKKIKDGVVRIEYLYSDGPIVDAVSSEVDWYKKGNRWLNEFNGSPRNEMVALLEAANNA